MSVFTDDDLKRLKEFFVIDKQFHANAIWTDRDLFEALLARLKAAETCAKHLQHMEPKCEFVKVWLGSKGSSGDVE